MATEVLLLKILEPFKLVVVEADGKATEAVLLTMQVAAEAHKRMLVQVAAALMVMVAQFGQLLLGVQVIEPVRVAVGITGMVVKVLLMVLLTIILVQAGEDLKVMAEKHEIKILDLEPPLLVWGVVLMVVLLML